MVDLTIRLITETTGKKDTTKKRGSVEEGDCRGGGGIEKNLKKQDSKNIVRVFI